MQISDRQWLGQLVVVAEYVEEVITESAAMTVGGPSRFRARRARPSCGGLRPILVMKGFPVRVRASAS